MAKLLLVRLEFSFRSQPTCRWLCCFSDAGTLWYLLPFQKKQHNLNIWVRKVDQICRSCLTPRCSGADWVILLPIKWMEVEDCESEYYLRSSYWRRAAIREQAAVFLSSGPLWLSSSRALQTSGALPEQVGAVLRQGIVLRKIMLKLLLKLQIIRAVHVCC